MYIPSTQKIGLKKRRKQSDNSLLDNFEPDENKIDEIEASIFNKITESVDKIFNVQSTEHRASFSGYQIFGNGLDFDIQERGQTIKKVNNERANSMEEHFQEIAEVPEEEEKDTRKGTV
jgi:hypothetical protein